MTVRNDPIDGFLARAGWGDAIRRPLAGDASSRRYERLRRGGDGAVLMDAGAAGEDETVRFAAFARHLDAIGLSAPRIIAADHAARLLLLEDFGDAVFARLIDADPKQEEPLYRAAVDVLIHLAAAPLPTNATRFSAAEMAQMTKLVFDWYAPEAAVAASGIIAELARVLASFDDAAPVLSLRDFHSENMIWLPERAGPRRVGLLDFQDAFLCHPAYDLASLLGDARRDVDPNLEAPLIDRYQAATGADPKSTRLAIAAFGAQRNLRILGVFARLCVAGGKPHYVDLIPRVWRRLLADLAHPALAPLRDSLLRHLPEPDPNRLARLKENA